MEKRFKQFAYSLIENCKTLSKVRSDKCSIPIEKYVHLQNFVQILVSNCYSQASVASEIGGVKEDQFLKLFREYLSFFIHIIDRLAYSIIGDPDRHIIMGELGELAMMLSINTLFPQSIDVKADECFEVGMGHFNVASQEYSRYKKLSSSGDEGKKDTLFWEFSKKMAEFKGKANNPAAIVGEEVRLFNLLNNLDIKSFIENIMVSNKTKDV